MNTECRSLRLRIIGNLVQCDIKPVPLWSASCFLSEGGVLDLNVSSVETALDDIRQEVGLIFQYLVTILIYL